jgi:hypothetical protein
MKGLSQNKLKTADFAQPLVHSKNGKSSVFPKIRVIDDKVKQFHPSESKKGNGLSNGGPGSG